MSIIITIGKYGLPVWGILAILLVAPRVESPLFMMLSGIISLMGGGFVWGAKWATQQMEKVIGEKGP